MTARVPAVLHALAAGELGLDRAKLITEATYRLDDATAARVAGQVVERAGGRNACQVRDRTG